MIIKGLAFMSLCEQTLQKLEKIMQKRLPLILTKYLEEMSSLVLVVTGDSGVHEKRKAAHDIKSASASVGAIKLSELAEQFETDESLSESDLLSLASHIECEFEAVKYALTTKYALLSESGKGVPY